MISDFKMPWDWSLEGWVYLILWVLANVGPMWVTIYWNKRSRPDPVRDKGYEAFVRVDYDKWSYSTALFTHFFFLPRFIIGWCSFFTGVILSVVVCIGSDPFKLPQWKKNIVRFINQCSFSITLPMGGFWMYRKRVDVDYSKYLGPNYTKTYDGAGMYV